MPGIQLGGLASGMDTESVINQLMQLEAQPGVRMAQQKKVSQAREQALKDILSRVKNLQMEAQNLKSVTTWVDIQTVDSSDSTKVTATRTGGAAPGAYSISVSRLASGDQWSMDYVAPTADDSFSITNTKTGIAQVVNVPANASLDQVVSTINTDPNSKVYAVNVNNKLVLSSRDTGNDAAFTVGATGGLSNATQLRTALDAQYSLDGGVTTKTSASNVVTDGIAGISFTLKTTVPTTSPVTLNVSNPTTDTAAVKSKIKSFVDQYNSTIDLIRSKLTEEKVKDPQTDADRAKGVLYNDSMLNGLLQRMRSTIGAGFDTGDANMDQLGEIGISTGAATGGAASPDALAGKLVIDDAKLTAALTSSPLTVRKLLGATAGTEGVGTRFDTMLQSVVQDNGDIDGRIKSADKEQADYDTQIATLNKRIDAKTAMLRAQFSAMEAAISRSQTLQASLASQLR
jgi:flagellar hook-associated protein 2